MFTTTVSLTNYSGWTVCDGDGTVIISLIHNFCQWWEAGTLLPATLLNALKNRNKSNQHQHDVDSRSNRKNIIRIDTFNRTEQ